MAWAMSPNMELAIQCLCLIREIADRGACSCNPEHVGYALQELSQVLLARTGRCDRVFEPVPAGELQNLKDLLSNLQLVDTFSQSMWYLDRN